MSADTSTPDYKETQAAITRAVADMRARGAEVIDPIEIPNLKELVVKAGGGETHEPGTRAILRFEGHLVAK